MSNEPKIARSESVGFKSFRYEDPDPEVKFAISLTENGQYEPSEPVAAGTTFRPHGWGTVWKVWYKIYKVENAQNVCLATSSIRSEPGSYLTNCVTGPLPIDPPQGT